MHMLINYLNLLIQTLTIKYRHKWWNGALGPTFDLFEKLQKSQKLKIF